MLKSVNAAQTFNNYVGFKCAEVFLLKEEHFSIVCTHCELKTFEFADFLTHFKNLHLISESFNANEPEVEIKVENDDPFDEAPQQVEQFTELMEVPMTPMKQDDLPLQQDCYDALDIKWLANVTKSEDEAEVEGENYDEGSYNEEEEEEEEEEKQRIMKTVNPKPKTPEPAHHKCPECNNTYRFAKNLERHIKKCHSGDQYNCSRCDKVFRQERQLNAHQRQEHDGYPCSHCDKVYKNKESLRVHEYNHSGARNFACDVEGCGKAFFNPKMLTIHRRIVHFSERNFICEICGYRTKKKAALVVHKRSHTGERPFVCKVCDKGFASKSLLCEHMPIHSTERPHKCDVCGASFSRAKALYHHKHLHLGVKKFVCSLCGRAYAQMAGLAGHMRQHKAEQF